MPDVSFHGGTFHGGSSVEGSIRLHKLGDTLQALSDERIPFLAADALSESR